jgi:hypothetical protein
MPRQREAGDDVPQEEAADTVDAVGWGARGEGGGEGRVGGGGRLGEGLIRVLERCTRILILVHEVREVYYAFDLSSTHVHVCRRWHGF